MKDYLDTVAEEISMYLGLKTEVDNKVIRVDTIAGNMNFEPIFGNLMEDVYRFVYVYGGKLQQYGIEQRIKEAKKEIGI